MPLHTLHPCCRVRREAFGLLFYDLRGPRLLFAESGGLLDSEALGRGEAVEAALGGRTRAERGRILALIERLRDRGFLREQPFR